LTELAHIDLQQRACPQTGTVEHFWFENPNVGLERTRFHRIEVPFAPSDWGLDWCQQPEQTSLIIEWLQLDVADPSALDGVVVSSQTHELELDVDLETEGVARNETFDLRTLVEDRGLFTPVE